jgi:deazaflavin-dependent oxidoreductase (nitroreductase family)
MSPLLGRRIAHFNRRVTNRLTRPMARRLPGFGVVIHTGRKSKHRYETPVNVFRAADGYAITLTYDAEADWVKNVLAAGASELITRGHRQRLTSPTIRSDERQSLVPRQLRPGLPPLRRDRVHAFEEGLVGGSDRLRGAPLDRPHAGALLRQRLRRGLAGAASPGPRQPLSSLTSHTCSADARGGTATPFAVYRRGRG